MRKNTLYEIARTFIHAYSKLLLRMDIHWHDPLPDGPKLFIANHPSASDPFLIHLLSRMSVLITTNAFAFPLFGPYLRRAGQIEVIPGGDAIEQACQLLRQGHSVGIFPEGDFSPQEGGFRKPRSGAARLALRTGVPIVPVGIYLPRERSLRIESKFGGHSRVGYWYLHGPYAITVGQPMRFEGDADNREHIQSVTDTMMEWIQSLTNESQERFCKLFPSLSSAAKIAMF